MAILFRDSKGKTLGDYKRPSVAVDTAVLGLDPDLGLVVLEVRRPSGNLWALPGTFLHEGEVLADAVERSLLEKANVRGVHPRQLHVFDGLTRDDRGWVLSVAHVAVVTAEQLSERFPGETRLVPANRPGRLIYDHRRIIELAVADVRSGYDVRPDPDHLLGATFTLRELRRVHESIAGREIQRDNFRRAMEAHLEPVGSPEPSGGRGRPAQRFRRR
ncbi:MAG TPA: NUDIX hydrolase [Mycobacterium sp.]|uniref:NUDIX hydrolase n=1 Tax=Mycolicibacterium sp. TaxID=2320850 RepID=UPI0025DF476B|nr:NUDIX domain-containing protein [Mycolicibacterium sp.]HPX37426.1 NUDIX hydrolase [Mycobacterium sp.]HQC75778.1 NUDIX hydrolase [Mycobacterium sp.]